MKVPVKIGLFAFLCLFVREFNHFPRIFFLQGEGVAYRGRLLVELESKLGEEIDKPLEKMKGPDLIRVQVTQPPAPELH